MVATSQLQQFMSLGEIFLILTFLLQGQQTCKCQTVIEIAEVVVWQPGLSMRRDVWEMLGGAPTPAVQGFHSQIKW